MWLHSKVNPSTLTDIDFYFTCLHTSTVLSNDLWTTDYFLNATAKSWR